MEGGTRAHGIERSGASLIAERTMRVPAVLGSARRLAAGELVWLGCCGGAIVVLCLAAYALRHVYVGDAAVYLPYAQHAAHGEFFQFNPGQFSSGATSPLWGVLLAIPYVFGLGLAGAKGFAAIAVIAAVVTAMVAAVRLTGSSSAGAVAGLFLLGTSWYALELYESALVLGAVAASLIVAGRIALRLDHDGPVGRAQLAALVGVWALLPLARPDAAIVAVCEAAALVFFAGPTRRRAARIAIPALLAAAVPAATYYGYSLTHLGTFSTSAAERTFALHEGAPRWVGPLYLSGDALHQLFATYWAVVTVPGLIGLGLFVRTRTTRWIGVTGLAVLLAYLLLLTFVSPGLTDTPRYLLPVAPFLVAGAARCLAAARAPRARVVTLCLGVALIGGLGIRDLHDRAVWLRSLGLSSNEVFERDAVARVNALARPGDVLLAYEVQLRYYLRPDVSVLSEDGITDAKVRPYQRPGALAAFLHRYRPRWWLADRNVTTRPYMRGSVLDQVFTTFEAHPALRRRTLDGIAFSLVARRSRPLAPGFGGWQMLFRLSYAGR